MFLRPQKVWANEYACTPGWDCQACPANDFGWCQNLPQWDCGNKKDACGNSCGWNENANQCRGPNNETSYKYCNQQCNTDGCSNCSSVSCKTNCSSTSIPSPGPFQLITGTISNNTQPLTVKWVYFASGTNAYSHYVREKNAANNITSVIGIGGGHGNKWESGQATVTMQCGKQYQAIKVDGDYNNNCVDLSTTNPTGLITGADHVCPCPAGHVCSGPPIGVIGNSTSWVSGPTLPGSR